MTVASRGESRARGARAISLSQRWRYRSRRGKAFEHRPSPLRSLALHVPEKGRPAYPQLLHQLFFSCSPPPAPAPAPSFRLFSFSFSIISTACSPTKTPPIRFDGPAPPVKPEEAALAARRALTSDTRAAIRAASEVWRRRQVSLVGFRRRWCGGVVVKGRAAAEEGQARREGRDGKGVKGGIERQLPLYKQQHHLPPM
jgi:hypothetical protein